MYIYNRYIYKYKYIYMPQPELGDAKGTGRLAERVGLVQEQARTAIRGSFSTELPKALN